MAIYVTSDLHGYPFERFMEFMHSVDFCSEDFLYIIGDVIDRGDDGVKYLEWLLTMDNVQLILGNHEAMMLACEFVFDLITEESLAGLTKDKQDLLVHWIQNGATSTIYGLKELLSNCPEKIADILDYLKDAPLYEAITVNERDFLLVHGGLGEFSPDKKFSEYKPFDLYWTRPTPATRYFDDITTIIGHTPVTIFAPESPYRMFATDTWIDIDTGAAFGGAPMLLRLDDMKEFYI